MKKRTLKIFVAVIILFITGGVIIFNINNDLKDLDVIGDKYVENIFNNEHFNLYRIRWGVSGNHSEIILKKKGTDNEIRFERPIFVEINQNKVVVYSRDDMGKYKNEWETPNLNLVTVTRDEFLKLNEKKQSSTFFKIMK